MLGVSVGASVAVAVAVIVMVGLAVGVVVAVLVTVTVAEAVAVAVAVLVGVGVSLGDNWLSALQPLSSSSVPSQARKWAAGGKLIRKYRLNRLRFKNSPCS